MHAGELAVRDALTGAPLQARIHALDGGGAALSADGRLRPFPATTLRGRVRIEAPAHRPLDITLGARVLPTTVLLDPLAEPEVYVRLAQRAALAPESRWLQGYTRDAVDGRALAAVSVAIEGRSTRSDESGYFEIEFESLDASASMTDTATGASSACAGSVSSTACTLAK